MAGDIYARIMIEKHKVFERKGADLVIEKKITLLEALTGFSFELEHLDGQKYTIATLPGEVVTPGKYIYILIFLYSVKNYISISK